MDSTDTSARSQPHPRGAYLVTGGTGWVGRYVVKRLIEIYSDPVYVLIRAADSVTPAERLARLSAFAGDSDGRLRVIPYDGALLGPLPPDIRTIFHCAAQVNFVGTADILETNVGLTWQLLHSAGELGRLERFIHLSTGSLRANSPYPFSEEDLDSGQQFISPYDLTKFLAEATVRKFYRKLPVTVIRPGSVLATTNGEFPHTKDWFYQTVRLWLDHRLEAIPLGVNQPINPIPVDVLAQQICGIAGYSDLPLVLHIPWYPGPPVGAIFRAMALALGRTPPSLYSQDSAEWQACYMRMNPLVQRVVDNLYPTPPPGQKLATLVSPHSQKWFQDHSMPSFAFPDSYWAILADAVAKREL